MIDPPSRDAGQLAAVPDAAPPEEPVNEALAETAADIEQIDVDAPRVAIVVAGREDLLILERTEMELDSRGISSEVRVISATEEPRAVADYTENAQLRGIRVIVAGAGPQARLPSMITAHTKLPVIGVPLTSQGARAGGLSALLSGGGATGTEPVAWVALDDATGAAILAARILST
jgi:phosphoribosylaminoimidazole carboxylase PurE protein